MADPIGITFMPNADNQTQGPQQGALNGPGGDLSDAFKILSLRLPSVLGASSLAPKRLLGSPGAPAGFNANAAVFTALLKAMMGGGGTFDPGGGGGFMPGPTGPGPTTPPTYNPGGGGPHLPPNGPTGPTSPTGPTGPTGGGGPSNPFDKPRDPGPQKIPGGGPTAPRVNPGGGGTEIPWDPGSFDVPMGPTWSPEPIDRGGRSGRGGGFY